MNVTPRAAAVLLTAAAAGDLVGLAHQLLSDDRPPIPAMVIGGLVGMLGLWMVASVLAGQQRAHQAAVVSRVVDVLLIGGAAASGHIFDEQCPEALSAVGQFVLSLVAAAALVAASRATKSAQPTLNPS